MNRLLQGASGQGFCEQRANENEEEHCSASLMKSREQHPRTVDVG